MAGGQDGSGLRLAADAGTGLHAVGGASGRSGHGPRAEIMDVDGHIAHVIEPGLSVCEAVVGRPVSYTHLDVYKRQRLPRPP